MKPSDILIAARALIDTPDKWTKGCFARNGKGDQTHTYDKNAVCFCTLGALFHASQASCALQGKPFDMSPENQMAENEAKFALGRAIDPGTTGCQFALWNDAPERTHAEVLAAYDTAIAALVAEGR